MPDRVRPKQRRWSGLDGLRALAVMAVMGFHFAPGVVPGGFLGVDVFFVLSGYLITRMIATEYLRSGRFRFGEFYRRRARRLLPGLGVILVAVLAASAFWRDQLTTVRAATAAAVAYVSNWWLTFAHHSYFVSAGRPSMLQHLWSLAVEEQFYLFWPLVAVGVLALAGRGRFAPPVARVRLLAGTAVVLAIGSATEMTVLAVTGNVPYDADASRLYYGTDTHSMGLLLGAALGALAAARARPQPGRNGATRFTVPVGVTDVLALGALTVLGGAVFTVSETSPALYRGGFLAIAVLAGGATAALTRPRSRAGRLLDAPALRWIAARSYAIYLWHWPVAVVTRPGVDVQWPAPVVLLVRVAVTVVLADLTYRVIEAPMRTLGARATWRRIAQRMSRVILGQAPVGARLVTAVLVTAVLVAGGVLVAGPRPALSATQRALARTQGGRALAIGPPPASGAPVRRIPVDGQVPLPAPVRPVTAAPLPVAAVHPTADRLPAISAFGDSVMLGARSTLDRHFPGGTMDAVEGRQADPILHDVQLDAARGRLNPLVVIGVGDNGLISPGMLRGTLERLRGVGQVIVVNLRVGRTWQVPNNRTIARIVPQFPNATLLDWHDESAAHASWFYDDGIHLTPSGALAYTRLIVDRVKRV